MFRVFVCTSAIALSASACNLGDLLERLRDDDTPGDAAPDESPDNLDDEDGCEGGPACEDGEVCSLDLGGCVANACDGDADCADGNVCFSVCDLAECRAPAQNGEICDGDDTECFTSHTCAPGLTCRPNAFAEPEESLCAGANERPNGIACAADDECASGTCDDFLENCVEHECDVDDDCADGRVCALVCDESACVFPAGANEYCGGTLDDSFETLGGCTVSQTCAAGLTCTGEDGTALVCE